MWTDMDNLPATQLDSRIEAFFRNSEMDSVGLI